MVGEYDSNNLKNQFTFKVTFNRSHPVRGAWIEMLIIKVEQVLAIQSHPVRGAWIEILLFFNMSIMLLVASRKGCVD